MYLSKKFQSVTPSSTLAITAKFNEMKASGIDVVGFGAGEPDFDTPEHIREAAIKAINEGFTRYTPASGTKELKQAVADKFARDNGLSYGIENIVISNGAKHSLMNVMGAILNPGDEVIIPTPCWVSYPEMVKLNDGVPVLLKASEEEGFLVSAEKIESAITDKTRAVIINTPSNPTGMIYSTEELRKIAKLCVEKNIYVISDEIYEHLIYDGGKHVSIASFGEDIKDLTIIINGVSKTYAMTGWRIGYTASNAKIAKVMSNAQSHATSNPNSIAQKAAVAALNGSMGTVLAMRSEFEKRRTYMVNRINTFDGVSCLMPKGAFYVMMNISELIGKSINGKKIEGSNSFAEIFLDEALVSVVPCSDFDSDIHVRWSYATSMENIVAGLDRLEAFIKKLD
ncbi:MAG: pyridoxal phosphate-dependent aminotransferase [Clostridia bacterium]|nr:pyridoxal phosphate-dependent aminotransferase [Clostridia bacterium]